MNTNSAVKKLNRKRWSIKSRNGGDKEEKKMNASQLIPRIVIPEEILGFRSRDFLMVTVIATCLIAPLVATIVVWVTVY